MQPKNALIAIIVILLGWLWIQNSDQQYSTDVNDDALYEYVERQTTERQPTRRTPLQLLDSLIEAGHDIPGHYRGIIDSLDDEFFWGRASIDDHPSLIGTLYDNYTITFYRRQRAGHLYKGTAQKLLTEFVKRLRNRTAVFYLNGRVLRYEFAEPLVHEERGRSQLHLIAGDYHLYFEEVVRQTHNTMNGEACSPAYPHEIVGQASKGLPIDHPDITMEQMYFMVGNLSQDFQMVIYDIDFNGEGERPDCERTVIDIRWEGQAKTPIPVWDRSFQEDTWKPYPG